MTENSDKVQYDVKNICRACLKDEISMKYFSDGDLQALFTKFTNLEISDDDDLPNKLCTLCVDKLNSSINFYQLCINSDYILKQQKVIKKENEEITDLCEANYSSDTEKFEFASLKGEPIKNEYSNDAAETEIENETKCKSELNERVCKKTSKEAGFPKVDIKHPKSKNTKKSSTIKKNKAKVEFANLEKKPHVCTICDREFSKPQNLKFHMIKHARTDLECTICNIKFDKKFAFECHVRRHTGAKRAICDICGGSFNNIKDHIINKHSDVKPHSCHICSKAFKQKAVLIQHLLRHSGKKIFMCTLCGHGTITKSDLERHMTAVHSDEKRFLCKTCPKGFNKATDLITHNRIHTGERPFQCDVCPMNFRSASVLKKHQVVHTGLKSHVCDVCDKAFARKDKLNDHKKVHK